MISSADGDIARTILRSPLRIVIYIITPPLEPVAFAASEHAAGQRAGMIFFFDQQLSVDNGHFDAERFLHISFLVARQVLDHFA